MRYLKSIVLAAALAVSTIGMASADGASRNASSNAGVIAEAQSAVSNPPGASQTGVNSAGENYSYQLGAGDKIRLSVFGESDLGGEFDIDGDGYVRLPLIGQVKAAGLTVVGFEQQIIDKLEDGYLKDPRVSIEVVNYRPFYIIGEVNKPGQYSYVDGMNALNAVALAGGYTARADKSEVYIQRGGKDEKSFPSDETTTVRPGDVVRVPERWF